MATDSNGKEIIEYPKIVKLDGKKYRFENAAEEAEALGSKEYIEQPEVKSEMQKPNSAKASTKGAVPKGWQ